MRSVFLAFAVLASQASAQTASPLALWSMEQTTTVLQLASAQGQAGGRSVASIVGSPLPVGSVQTGYPTSGSALQLVTFPAAGAANSTAGWQFCVPTDGVANLLSVSFALRSSNTGSKFKALQARAVAGGPWLDLSLITALTPAGWDFYVVDISGVASQLGLNNNPSLCLRVVMVFAPGGTAYVATQTGSNYGTAGTQVSFGFIWGSNHGYSGYSSLLGLVTTPPPTSHLPTHPPTQSCTAHRQLRRERSR